MITHTHNVNGRTVTLTYGPVLIEGRWLIWDDVNVCYLMNEARTGPRRFARITDALAYLETLKGA